MSTGNSEGSAAELYANIEALREQAETFERELVSRDAALAKAARKSGESEEPYAVIPALAEMLEACAEASPRKRAKEHYRTLLGKLEQLAGK